MKPDNLLDWSITDGNADATNLTGDVRVEEVSATGQKIGPEYDWFQGWDAAPTSDERWPHGLIA